MPRPRSNSIDLGIYVLVRLIVGFAQMLTIRQSYALARLLAKFFYRIDARHRAVGMENLKLAFGDAYNEALETVRATSGGSVTRGALASACKLCHWYTHCRNELTQAGDLSLIPYLGRALRDGMGVHIASLGEFAAVDPDTFIEGKKTKIPGLGID